MTQKDTLPSLSDMNNQGEDEDAIYMADIDEIIIPDDTEETYFEDGDEMELDPLGKSNAVCIFTGHKPDEDNSKNILGSVFCGSLTKDGKLAVSGGEDDKAYLWDATSGEILLHCMDHIDSIIFAEFNYDESYLATGDMSGMIQIWRMSDKVKIRDYNMGDATWMKWHTAANVLLAGSITGEIHMWKIPSDDCKVFQGYGCRAETAAIFPDGKRIAVGYEDGVIRTVDLKTGSVLSSVSSSLGHSTTITTIDCHSDDNLVLSAAVDGKTIISTSKQGKIVAVLQNLHKQKHNIGTNNEDAGSSDENDYSNWVETAAFCRDPTFQVAATGTVKGEIFVWDILKQVLRQKMEIECGVSKLLWKGKTSVLFAAGLDGVLYCMDGRNLQCLQLFTGHSADILDLYLSENGTKALTTSDDSTARIFDISSFS